MTREFPQLCPDERPWRIDWLGNLAYPGEIRRYRQPCISVSISPLADAGCRINEQQDVWVPLGALPMINVGDVWHDGKLLSSCPQDVVTFRDIQIGEGTTKIVKAGVDIGGAFLLPFGTHPWHKAHTNTYCLACKINDDQQLIIPCLELIKFYFGSASSLLDVLCTKPFEESALWTSKHYDPETEHLHIKLADRLSASAAPDVARIAMSHVAKRAATQIYASCAKATSQKQPAYPCTFFPFEGKTTLQVTGSWIGYQHVDKGAFVVSSLRSCSHQFPFGSLTYEIGDKAQAWKDKQAAKPEKPIATYVQAKKQVLSGEDPGGTKKTAQFSSERKVRFPDLTRKRVWLERIGTQDDPEVIMLPSGLADSEEVSFGNPEGSSSIRAVDAADGYGPVEDTNVELPKFAKLGIEHFIKTLTSSVQYEYRPLLKVGQASVAFQLPLLVDSDGVIDERTRFAEPNGNHRQRMACYFGLYQNNQLEKTAAVVEGKSVRDYPVSLLIAETDMRCLLSKLTEPKTTGE